MEQLPKHVADKLDMVEGTLMLTVNLTEPLGDPPSERETLIAGVSPSGVLAHVDIDEQLHLHWCRRAPHGGAVGEVGVDVSPLRGAKSLGVGISWSPVNMAVTVVDRFNPSRMVGSEAE